MNMRLFQAGLLGFDVSAVIFIGNELGRILFLIAAIITAKYVFTGRFW